jgi:hypothetical protein
MVNMRHTGRFAVLNDEPSSERAQQRDGFLVSLQSYQSRNRKETFP